MGEIRGTEPGNNSRKNLRGSKSTKEDRRAQAELMWEDKLKGLTNAELAQKYRLGLRTVTKRFAEFPKEGYEERPRGLAGSGDQLLNLTVAESMWEDKLNHRMTNKQLAEKYGVTVQKVRQTMSSFFPEKTMIALEKHRMRENDKLDMLDEQMMEILNKDHYVVDKGQVIFDPYTNQPLIDDAPKMAAADRIIKIIEAKRKLFGLDSPTRHEVNHTTDNTIEIREVADAVAEAHRRNEEKKLRMIQERTRALASSEEEIQDAEVVSDEEVLDAEDSEDGSAPMEDG